MRIGPIHEICSVLSGSFLPAGIVAVLTGGDASTTAGVMLMIPIGSLAIIGFGKLYGRMITDNVTIDA